MNYLIVEDDFIIQLFLEETLVKMGHTVIGCASNSRDTFNILEKEKPDIILLDVGLEANESGIDIAHEINLNYHIPFVFLTGNSDDLTRTKLKELEPISIITKPMDEVSLKELIKNIQLQNNNKTEPQHNL